MALKRVQQPMSSSLKILFKLIYLDNAQYLTKHFAAPQLCLSKAVYIKAIRAVVINSLKSLTCREVTENNQKIADHNMATGKLTCEFQDIKV